MHERRFNGDIGRLRSPARRELLEVDRVTRICLNETQIRNMLDVGTGSGLFAESFNQQGIKVSGIDVAYPMAMTAKQFVPGGHFVVSTAEAIPFADASFDLVFMALVWHETDDRFRALQEARRLARLQVCILEWVYSEAFAGPPLSDRIDPEKAQALAGSAGFAKMEILPLSQTVLYHLTLP